MRNLAVIAALFVALPLAAQQPATSGSANAESACQADSRETGRGSRRTPLQPPSPRNLRPPKSRLASDTEGKVVEEIVARVNNEIITRSEFDHSKATAEDDAKQECQNRCTPEQLKVDGRGYAERTPFAI